MKFVWLLGGIGIFIGATIDGFINGFTEYSTLLYIFVAIAVGMYFFKTVMMKRFEEHSKFLKEKKEKSHDKQM